MERLNDVVKTVEFQKYFENYEIIISLFNNINDGLIIVNENGHIIIFNTAFLKIFNLSKKDIYSKKIWEIKHNFVLNFNCEETSIDTIKKTFINYYNSSLDIFKNQPREIVIQMKDGSRKFLEEEILKFETHLGKLVLFRFKDITIKKDTEYNEEIKKQYEATKIMLRGIAHNFNTRFQGIIGNITCAMNYLNKDEKPYIYLQNAIDSFPKINEFIKQFILLSDENEFEFSNQVINPIFTNLLSEQDSLKYKLLIDKIESPIIYCNLYLLKDALMNIIQNAKESMELGGIIRITFTKEKCINTNFSKRIENDFFCINIIDEGIGIPEENINKIFDPFFTTNIAKKKGLGLTITYYIIKKHNGLLKVESELGKGTKVKIFLPIVNNTQ